MFIAPLQLPWQWGPADATASSSLGPFWVGDWVVRDSVVPHVAKAHTVAPGTIVSSDPLLDTTCEGRGGA